MKFLVLLFLIIFCLPSTAQENFQLSGFGTLGLVNIDSEHYGFRPDISYEDGTFKNEWDLRTTSILGIQPEYRINDQFDLVSQFIYRNQNKFSLDTVTRMAFLRYSPQADLSFRFGRTTIDLFHLSEYTDVGFAHPWAKVPTEVYGLITYRHLDGIDVSKSFQLDNSTLRAKIFAGESKAHQSSYLEHDELGITNVRGLSLEWDTSNLILKGNYTRARAKNEVLSTKILTDTVAQIDPVLWPNNLAFAEELTLKNKRVSYASISGQLFLSDWSIITEFSSVSGDGIFLRPVKNGYTSLIYNYKKHAFYTTYSYSKAKAYRFDQNVDRTTFSQLITEIELAGNFLNSTQKSISIGWRWNVTEQLALKTQFERTDIDANDSALWVSKTFNFPSEVVNSLYFNMSFIF